MQNFYKNVITIKRKLKYYNGIVVFYNMDTTLFVQEKKISTNSTLLNISRIYVITI